MLTPAPSALTLDEWIAAKRDDQQRHSRECIAAIKAVHAQTPTRIIRVSEWRAKRSRMFIQQGPGAIAKFKKHSRQFRGWYRDGQTRGMPNTRHPVTVKLDTAFDDWATALRRGVPENVRAAQRGQRSGQVRRETGLEPQILDAEAGMHHLPKHHRAKAIAQALDCNIEYVRRVLHRHSTSHAS